MRTRSSARTFVLLGVARHSCLECIPGKQGALHSCGELADAAQRARRPERLVFRRFSIAHHHVSEARSERFDFLELPALHELCHHRRGCLRDRAAPSREAEITYNVAVELHVDSDLVPAKRILHQDRLIRSRKLTLVSRAAVMIEDHLLIKRTDLRGPV